MKKAQTFGIRWNPYHGYSWFLGGTRGVMGRIRISYWFVVIQGHPTTVFCKMSLRRSKYCVEFCIA